LAERAFRGRLVQLTTRLPHEVVGLEQRPIHRHDRRFVALEVEHLAGGLGGRVFGRLEQLLRRERGTQFLAFVQVPVTVEMFTAGIVPEP
jgi:hypothetical protein